MPTKKKITGKLEIKSRKKRKQYSEGKSKTVSRTKKKKHRGQNSWFKVEFGIAIETHTLDTLQYVVPQEAGHCPTAYEYVLQVTAPSCNSFPLQGPPSRLTVVVARLKAQAQTPSLDAVAATYLSFDGDHQSSRSKMHALRGHDLLHTVHSRDSCVRIELVGTVTDKTVRATDQLARPVLAWRAPRIGVT